MQLKQITDKLKRILASFFKYFKRNSTTIFSSKIEYAEELFKKCCILSLISALLLTYTLFSNRWIYHSDYFMVYKPLVKNAQQFQQTNLQPDMLTK